MMKKNIYLKNELLKILLASSNHTLQAFTLNKRLGLASNVFFDLIFELEKEGLIHIDGVFIKLLEQGIVYILSIMNVEKKNKSKIPNRFLSDSTLKINEFYIPKRSLL
ncbi:MULTISPECIES: hypothetical protein [unclassified Acinetobacter]|uniref:hypothetical protein n=1 Tax=unclassified Acinetobacter TaxID=196816 RepID=UPI00211EF644|nr:MULTISPECIES: hypothetical protein [unclassified Acinetobacter]